MKYSNYIVTFINKKTVYTSAFNKNDAEILASAIMIKNGFTREVESIIETTDVSDIASTDFVA